MTLTGKGKIKLIIPREFCKHYRLAGNNVSDDQPSTP